MASILSEFHPSIVTYLTLRHCRELELPHQLQTFSRLMKIDIYNSTIVAWPDDAALTATHHPYLAMVYLRLVEFGGTLPACLLAKTFPPTVGEIIIAFTDLTSLPENLREVWPGPLGMLVIEHSPLESLPVSFLTSVNFTENLSFSGNQITTLPIEIFQLCCAAVLMIDNPITNISQGQAPTEIAMKASIDLSGSRLVSLPEWMSADYLHAQDVLIVLGGSPLCDLLIEEFTALLMTPSLDVAGKNCSSTDNESSMSDYDFFSKISANKSIWCSTTTEYMVNLLSYEELASLPNGADGV
ncbi:TPA: hypothetical protein N0F65_010549 [Lagenidium giganteum]|uniref:Uncharacterized protein n=1 Tax=Lagenidium giganteum TaxID=4803 RepID=A0AAV2Z9P0_9STRA|nr:TPA: hypothetical protein N0F65_010549 [Lagenidium giganteum]